MIFKDDISQIADNYDYFILDVWGVIHDGIQAYDGVVERLKYLKGLGKKVCFLSNAPRRANKVAQVLKDFKITEDLYDFIITSGEATYLFLQENHYHKNLSDLIKQGLKDKENPYLYYYIGPEKDADLLDGLGYHATSNASKADFAVATGFDDGNYDIADKMPQLKTAKEHNLTLICVNPDLIVIRKSGEEILCAGVLALEYQKLGGNVEYFGKPYHLVYDQVFRLFSIKDKTKVLAVGDGMETDILGARNNNIDSALIPGGILANRLKIKYGQLPAPEDLEKICRQSNVWPKFVIGGL